MKLSALKRKRNEQVVGRTPPDWDLEDETGQRFYLKLTVRRDTCDEWQEFRRSNQAWVQEATARRMAREITGANGARKYAGGRFTPLVGDSGNEEFYRAIRERMSRSRDDQRAERARMIDAVRNHLLVDIELCGTDAAPSTAVESGRAKIRRVTDLLDEMALRRVDPESLEWQGLERELAKYEKELADIQADDRWLAVDDSARGRAPTASEMAILFDPSLPTDVEAYVPPDTWTFCGAVAGTEITIADALCSVILALAALASRGIDTAREAEIYEVKDMPSSGVPAPPPRKKAQRTSKPAS